MNLKRATWNHMFVGERHGKTRKAIYRRNRYSLSAPCAQSLLAAAVDRARREGFADDGTIWIQPGLDQRQSGISQRLGKFRGDCRAVAGAARHRRNRALFS